jgi:hypothetical protein
VACHTLTHPDLAKVPAGMDPGAYGRWVGRELGESKRRLEEGLGHRVDALAWPYGAYNPALAAAARGAGYTQLWSVSGGLNRAGALDAGRLRRILLMGHPSLDSFKSRFAAAPLDAEVAGLQEGGLFFRSQLPAHLRVQGPAVGGADGPLRAVLGDRPLPFDDAQGGLTLPLDLRDGFHFLVLRQGPEDAPRETPYLFQVAPDSWKPDFYALAGASKP